MSAILRTPDARFEGLADYPFAPHYLTVAGLRIHYVDEGPRDSAPILLLHGEPSWSYLYRKMIPILVAAGHRVIAPDLLGFGRSDKPSDRAAYTYPLHVEIISTLVRTLDLHDITLFCQDWGGLIGLRTLAELPERFARVVAANTGLPSLPAPVAGVAHRVFRWAVQRRARGGKSTLERVLSAKKASRAFFDWVVYSQSAPTFDVGAIVARGTVNGLTREAQAAYDAPFPDDSFKAGARAFPLLVTSDLAANHRAWRVLKAWHKPFLTAFSDSDAITRGIDRVFQRDVPGARGQPHVTIRGAGHFLQEDKGEELAQLVIDFIAR